MQFPQFLTHYYHEHPFRSLTMLDAAERSRVLDDVATRRELPRRLSREYRDFYFDERLRYECVMYDQFVAKGGQPKLQRPHYAVLGESEIWANISPQLVRIALDTFSTECISFTFTDSWAVYVDRDLRKNHIPRKPQYGTVYRLEELADLFSHHGWPGDRWKTEAGWEHDVYVEAQIWSDEPLEVYLPD